MTQKQRIEVRELLNDCLGEEGSITVRKELKPRHKVRCHLSSSIREAVRKVARTGQMQGQGPEIWLRGMGARSCGHLGSVTFTVSKIRSHCMVFISHSNVPVAQMGHSQCSDGKESACKARDLGSIPGSGRSPGEGNGSSLQYSCLESSMDRGTWWATVHGVAKSWTRPSDLTLFTKCVDLKPAGPPTPTPRTVSETTRGCISARRIISLGGSGEMQW